MNKIKVFDYICFGSYEEEVEFSNAITLLTHKGIIVKKEEGKLRPWDSEPIGYSYEGDEKTIRTFLNFVHPDYINDEEWNELEIIKI